MAQIGQKIKLVTEFINIKVDTKELLCNNLAQFDFFQQFSGKKT